MNLQHADTPGGTGTPRQDPWQSHEHHSLPRAQLHGSRHFSSALPSSPSFPTGLGAEAAPCVPPAARPRWKQAQAQAPAPGGSRPGSCRPLAASGGQGRAGPRRFPPRFPSGPCVLQVSFLQKRQASCPDLNSLISSPPPVLALTLSLGISSGSFLPSLLASGSQSSKFSQPQLL